MRKEDTQILWSLNEVIHRDPLAPSYGRSVTEKASTLQLLCSFKWSSMVGELLFLTFVFTEQSNIAQLCCNHHGDQLVSN